MLKPHLAISYLTGMCAQVVSATVTFEKWNFLVVVFRPFITMPHSLKELCKYRLECNHAYSCNQSKVQFGGSGFLSFTFLLFF